MLAVFMYNTDGEPVASWDSWDDFAAAVKLSEVPVCEGHSLHLMTKEDFAEECRCLLGGKLH